MKKLVDGVELEMTPEEVAEWEAAQNVPAPVVIPTKVTRAQFILALLELDLLDVVEAAVSAADRATQINYRERLEFERSHPVLSTMAAVLGKTDSDIDALFLLAASK